MSSRRAFRIACQFVKSASLMGIFKRSILANMPMSYLRRKFPVHKLGHAPIVDVGAGVLGMVRPWAQRSGEKAVVISFNESLSNVYVYKVGFSQAACDLISHEHLMLNYLVGCSPECSSLVPGVVNYVCQDDYCLLKLTYSSGNYSFSVPDEVAAFLGGFQTDKVYPLLDHPYVREGLQRLLELEHLGLGALRKQLTDLIFTYRAELIPVTLMHGDFAYPNLLRKGGQFTLIDWEEAVEVGMPIDMAYFEMQGQLLRDRTWQLNGAIDVLALFHRILLLLHHGAHEELNRIILSTDNSLSLSP